MSVRMIAMALLAALTLPGTVHAERADPPLFAASEPLPITLTGDLDALHTSGARVAATLAVVGEPAPLAVTLSPRGITRQRRETCAFPPVRIDFGARVAAGSAFAGQKRLKLVAYCRADARFQRFVLLEYAAYRMYQLLTPVSYRVRLARVSYRDARGRAQIERLGFFIEDSDDVARRAGLTELETQARIPSARLDAVGAERFALFQLMIGNLDWSMVAGPPGANCCHNAKLLAPRDGAGALVPLPYDFDFAGLVDAPYATPPEGIVAASVRERRFRGYCRHADQLPAAAADLLARRGAIEATLAINDLDAGTRRKALGYLAGFFDQIGARAGLARIAGQCIR